MPVKIKGKDYPITPTMWALLQFKRDKNKNVSEIPPDDIELMLYYTWLCVKGACFQHNIDFNLSFEEYVESVEGDPTEALILEKVESIKKKENQSQQT